MQMLINFLLENQIVHLSLHSHLLMRYLIRFELTLLALLCMYMFTYVGVPVSLETAYLHVVLDISVFTCQLTY